MDINDFKFTLEFIDAMSKRGAIAGQELYHIGILRTKVEETIKALEAENPPENDQSDPS